MTTMPNPRLPIPSRVPTEVIRTGACRNSSVPPQAFDWDEDSRPADRGALAKEVCAACPVARMCLEYAERNERDGIWGGLTPRERQMRSGIRAFDRVEAELAAELDVRLKQMTTAEVACELGVSERTVYRWKIRRAEALREMGIAS